MKYSRILAAFAALTFALPAVAVEERAWTETLS